MTTAVTIKEDAGMTMIAMCMAGVYIGVMATRNEFMFRRRSSTRRFHRRSFLCRPHRRASVSFFHLSFFITNGVASGRLPFVQSEVIWAAKEIARELNDNPELEAEGAGEKIAGKVQEKIGQVKNVLRK